YRCDAVTAEPGSGENAEDDVPMCGIIHRDLRPGRLGVWNRRCQCGTPLPTTVRRAAAAATLTSVCSNCSRPLYERAGLAQDARIALSGGPGVGKTQLL